ncbi:MULTISPECIES: 4-amino-4-deoxy-L-arabinose-phosphoundecaprenol flippase subunit ArnF [Sodalis]|jgi:undecaprenyl phosphate-alpha-L-ara4N flippase subunit ArnF|uniref:Probable 4-amino-4-deoxy-L-arabinose-phosphoundecaprenol flippase subunit ArnF n=1 Tax=Sodalis ligni TaxID=2697027 RepID=A0A4R1NBF6_9GAMM|nr:4-amino-4-deoxy-L-arabinose-phosphoundecaprenol flippase subunit ArnF [Sodalis ligni]TCL04652.1 undecaprenyl phosphate-alpha-L-ara4N flippase subunit ArnF [Sodalis ligni]
MKGLSWAAASVLLVTVAQLLMKWGMAQIPLLPLNLIAPGLVAYYGLPLLALAGGILAYALSMLCWFYALLYLPLSTAYPLISISYALVYFAAVLLPWFNETATFFKTFGVAFILFGVWLINGKHSGK